jgi:hypothetical protein
MWGLLAGEGPTISLHCKGRHAHGRRWSAPQEAISPITQWSEHPGVSTVGAPSRLAGRWAGLAVGKGGGS